MAVPTPMIRRRTDVATVTLVVGETKTAFRVHEADLSEASPFFKAAFTSGFRESLERTMILPEDNESTFELFVDWLYHQCYDMPSPPKDTEQDYDRFLEPVQLYVLADRYHVRRLKGLILFNIFHLMKQLKCGPTLHTVAYAYDHTTQNAAVRRLFADYLAFTMNHVHCPQANTQAWLRSRPDVSVDMISSFAKHTLTRNNPFAEDMPEDYAE